MALHLLSLAPPTAAAPSISYAKAAFYSSTSSHCRQFRGFHLVHAYLQTGGRGTRWWRNGGQQRRRRGDDDEDEVGFRCSCSTATSHGAARTKPKEVVLGTPSVRVEKGKYSYEVETLIDKLSSLPPRGSIARCLESFKNRLSLNDFALVFKEFARRGDWQRSLRLFKYMQRQSWCRPNEHIHAIVIGVLGREALLDKCLDIFDHDMPAHAVPRTALSYTALINAFGRNGDHATALDLLDRMKRPPDRVSPTVLTYNTVINACARDAQVPWDTLLGLFAQMRHEGVHPDLVTYNTLLAACGSRGLGDEAEMVFHTMNEAGILPDVATHTYLVETFGKLGRLSRVNDLLREMEAVGNVPEPACYNVLMEAYAQDGAAREAVGVLRQMQAAGCSPNAATYSVLLNLYGRSGQYDDVRELFLEMKVGSTEPDASTYNILIKVFGEGGYFKEVVTLFHDMMDESVEPDMETYESLMFACGKGGLYHDAKKILSRMNSKGVVPSTKVYSGMVEAYGQAALYEEAIVAFNTMHEIGSLPTIETYNSLVHMFARGGLFKEAHAILTRMDGTGIQRNEDSFNGLIEAFCQGGQFEEALKVYVEMQKTRCKPNEQTLERVLNVYCSAGLAEESREQFLEIQSLGFVPSVIAYCLLLSVYAKNDRWDDAHQLLEEMKTNRVSNIHQVVGSMIKGEYDDVSNWQMVEYVFDKFNSEGCSLGLRFYNAVMEALWWLGQRARAARVLCEATRRGLFPELYRQSKLVWSVDVHRMSVGGALTAISTWLNDVHGKLRSGDDLPQLAAVVVVRGEMEKSSATRGFPVAKAAYAFLKDNISSSFSFPGWNKGRIICQRPQLKRLSLTTSERSPDGSARSMLVFITDWSFPQPGARIYMAEIQNEHSTMEKNTLNALELMVTAAS
uniref:Pentatricopeptide repeat-containing protein At1g74850, chloroplastic n=2 Tax=Anthurium amnicola TaxID=1678845 RepID=A0A1D1ZB86_9ARAE